MFSLIALGVKGSKGADVIEDNIVIPLSKLMLDEL